MIRVLATAGAMLALAACADREAKAPTATPTGAPADTSATSPSTVNPEPKAAAPSGQSLPQTPPVTTPDQEDKSMPPGPVNPTPKR